MAEHDTETLFWQWGERFPSLAGMERWQWQDIPFWQVIAEAWYGSKGGQSCCREMERWMVPEQTPGGSVMRQQSHGFPVNGLNDGLFSGKVSVVSVQGI